MEMPVLVEDVHSAANQAIDFSVVDVVIIHDKIDVRPEDFERFVDRGVFLDFEGLRHTEISTTLSCIRWN